MTASEFNANFAKEIGADYEEAYDMTTESWWAVMDIISVKPGICDGLAFACRWDGETREDAAETMKAYLLSEKGRAELDLARSELRKFDEAA